MRVPGNDRSRDRGLGNLFALKCGCIEENCYEALTNISCRIPRNLGTRRISLERLRQHPSLRIGSWLLKILGTIWVPEGIEMFIRRRTMQKHERIHYACECFLLGQAPWECRQINALFVSFTPREDLQTRFSIVITAYNKRQCIISCARGDGTSVSLSAANSLNE